MESHSENQSSSSQRFQACFQAAKRDSAEVSPLLELCRPLLRLMARQSLGNEIRSREGDSDIVQLTIIEALSDFQTFQGNTTQEFWAWIKQLHRHNIQNLVRFHRAEKRDLGREIQLHRTNESDVSLSWYVAADKVASPAIEIVKVEKALLIAAAIQQLPELQRTAITMRHIDGTSLADICTAMDKTPAAVAGLLRRGLQALRQSLGNESSWI